MDIDYMEPMGARTAIVMCGWPDTADVFASNIVPLLRAHGYRVAGITLPTYRNAKEASPRARGCKSRFFGWSLEQLVVLFKEAVDEIMANTAHRPILVCHDWACTIALECLTEFPFLFERIVVLDVSGHVAGDKQHRSLTNVASWLVGPHGAVPLRTMVCILWYQLWIMASYLLSLVVPALGDVSILVLCWLGNRPVYRSKDGLKVRPRADMGWPYFHLWFGLLTRMPLQTHRFFTPVHVPVLYLYGEKKPFQFHTQMWLRHIAERGERDGMSKSLGIGDGGHWFFAQGGLPQQLSLRHIEAFLTAEIPR